MFDLPYEILESIVSLVAGSQDRKWPQVVFFLPRPGQKPVDPGPTNHLCTLMQVSKTLNEVAGSALYSRLTWTDIASGALRIMSPSKIDHLAQGRNIRLTYHDTGANRGSLFLAESLQPVKDVYLRIFGLPESTRKLSSSCHPVYCPIVQQIIPQTLVVWTRNLHLCTCRCYWESNCQHLHSYNLAIAKYYHPYPIQNLIVRVGKLSAWNDEGTVIAKIQTWFRSFVKTRSVVFMVDNPYIWNTTKAGRKRDMRYNPEDNLHPWVSMFMKSLLEYSLGDYAKDITVVNIGSIRSETLGLAEEYWKIKADFKCERCYAEKEFEKLFMLKYGKQLSDRTGSELRPVANVKFIPFSEYLDTYDWRGTVSRVDEKYYIHEYDERRFVKGRGYIRRTCHKCDHPEEELDIKCVSFLRLPCADTDTAGSISKTSRREKTFDGTTTLITAVVNRFTAIMDVFTGIREAMSHSRVGTGSLTDRNHGRMAGPEC